MWPHCGEVSNPEVMTRESMEQEIKYKTGNAIEKFIFELFFRMMRNEDRVICKAEIDLIKNKYLLNECNNMEFEQRKSLYKTLKRVMIYAGIIDLHVQVLP